MKQFLAKVAKLLVQLINAITPKKKNWVFLRSYFPYPDNVQAILDEMLKQNFNLKNRIYCAGNGFDNYKSISNVFVLKKNKFFEILKFIRCKFVIWDSSIYFNIKCSKRQTSFNLWHGVSFKKIGFYETPTTKKYQMSTYVVTYSDLFKDKMSEAFGVPMDNVLITGEPRNDYLGKPVCDEMLSQFGIPVEKKQLKLVIWMPTFRQSKNHNVNNGKLYEFGFPFLSENNLDTLHRHCVENSIFLILKWHGSQVLPKKEMHKFTNFLFLTTDMLVKKQLSLYQIVAKCDALITDYSSIFVNFMILNRPICFAYDDLDLYEKDRGFMFADVEQLMPGFKAKDFDSLLLFLKSVSIDNDEYLKERSLRLLEFNKYNDFCNSKRLVDFIVSCSSKND